MSTDWFRNATWNEAVEKAFEEKLRRARRKEQYLRIQACTLAASFPAVALTLLDRYFGLPEGVDRAAAHVHRATALLALGLTDDAIASYEAALAREAGFPNFLTTAYLDLPYLIATRGLREHYSRAIQLLEAGRKRLTFPLDHFHWHCARALIAAEENDPAGARLHAERALAAAAIQHSGFRYHPTVGLVGEEFVLVIRKLEAYLAS